MLLRVFVHVCRKTDGIPASRSGFLHRASDFRHLGKAYPKRSVFVNAVAAYQIFSLDTVVRRSARIRTVDEISRATALDHVPDWRVQGEWA